ncbi:MAG: hypothetical protein A2061_04575 [Gallionellales bacterium GWA2_59_43]|nr:MAG: hypothetical protein A2061_04575 [Gallionellales bacterium GWA2_59_43]
MKAAWLLWLPAETTIESFKDVLQVQRIASITHGAGHRHVERRNAIRVMWGFVLLVNFVSCSLSSKVKKAGKDFNRLVIFSRNSGGVFQAALCCIDVKSG